MQPNQPTCSHSSPQSSPNQSIKHNHPTLPAPLNLPRPPDGEHYHLNTSMLATPHSPTPSPAPRIAPSPPRPGPKHDWIDDQIRATLELPDGVHTVVRQITRDSTLSDDEKNLRRQHILSYRFWKRHSEETDEKKQAMEQQSLEISYSDSTDEQGNRRLGCSHYLRACKIQAKCCGMWVVCRHCHDEAMDHVMNRFETEQVMCMLCGKVQPVAAECISCSERFARYFCAKCRFYDDAPNKDIYHCDDCGICRVGRFTENYHCKKCNACVSSEYFRNHRCLKNSLDANCPICSQYLFTSTSPVVFMRCGHTMHANCFDEYTLRNYTCPLCHKQLTNMTPFYRDVDRLLEQETMPEEQQNRLVKILCHDCNKRSDTKFHFSYLKCQHCHGYNTVRVGEAIGDNDAATEAATGSTKESSSAGMMDQSSANNTSSRTAPSISDADNGNYSIMSEGRSDERQFRAGDLRQAEARETRSMLMGIFDYADEQNDGNAETVEVHPSFAVNGDVSDSVKPPTENTDSSGSRSPMDFEISQQR